MEREAINRVFRENSIWRCNQEKIITAILALQSPKEKAADEMFEFLNQVIERGYNAMLVSEALDLQSKARGE